MFKSRRFVLIFLLVSLIDAGLIAMANSPEVPVRKAVVRIQVDQLELFFDQMRAFAEAHGFAIRIAPTAPTGKDFIVELWREDFKILAANPFDKGTFRVSIFNILGRDIESKYIDSLVEELKRSTLEVEGAEFEVEAGNQ